MSDLREYLSEPSTWFSETLTYTGIGRIEFSNPKGWIEGEIICEVNQIGNMDVRLKIKSWKNYDNLSDDSSVDDLYWLLSGIQPQGIHVTIPIIKNNLISSLEVQTIDGNKFSSTDIFYYTYNLREHYSITIHLNRATYSNQNKSKSDIKYWILPCINLNPGEPFGITQSHLYSDLREHPLRIFPISQKTNDFLQSDAPIQDKGWVEHNTIAQSYVVAFLYKNALAFIERLPEYHEKIKQLEDGTSRLAITSLMIGEHNLQKDEIYPVNLLPVLGLATGRPVGASWIEFRDENGELVYRIHANFGQYSYGRGRPNINDGVHEGGLGRLLTEASRSDVIDNPLIRGALRNCAEGISGQDGTTIFYNTFTALDGLFKYYNIERKIHPLKSFLTTTQIEDIETILEQTQREIKKLESNIANLTSADGKMQQSIIKKIADKARSDPLGKRTKFGDKLVEIMRHIGLLDTEVLSQYYNDIEYWIDKVTRYRNTTMHNTHYDDIFSNQTKQDFEQLLPHLIDILIRILLKTIGYSGNYAPFMQTPNHSADLDWVSATISPKSLGYK